MKQKFLDQYRHLTQYILCYNFKTAIVYNFTTRFKNKFALHI